MSLFEESKSSSHQEHLTELTNTVLPIPTVNLGNATGVKIWHRHFVR
jgi:hypothetical protein